MNPFKIGDSVVLVDTDVDSSLHFQPATVVRLNGDDSVGVVFKNSYGTQRNFYSRRFVLECVYNSPLYKALNESNEGGNDERTDKTNV